MIAASSIITFAKLFFECSYSAMQADLTQSQALNQWKRILCNMGLSALNLASKRVRFGRYLIEVFQLTVLHRCSICHRLSQTQLFLYTLGNSNSPRIAHRHFCLFGQFLATYLKHKLGRSVLKAACVRLLLELISN